MNTIPTKQNESGSLRQLAAMRSTYSVAKKVFGFQMFLSVPVSVAVALIALACPAFKGYAACIGVLATLANFLWLTPWQLRLRKEAASIQEVFDCYVLELPWNEIKVGSQPDPELVKERADRYSQSRSQFPPLRDWYPVVVGEVDLVVGRVICQRVNCQWDSNLRRNYASIVVTAILVCCLLVLAIGMVGGLSVENLMLSVIAPLLPAISFAIQQWREHHQASKRLDELKQHSENLIDAIVARVPSAQLLQSSRNLQDEIYDSRARNAAVFDFLFNVLRPDYESQMRFGANVLVARIKQSAVTSENK